MFIPLFSFCIAIPALFNFVTPGDPVWFFYLFGIKFIITRPGLDGAILFVVRVATSVSLVVLLSLTTQTHAIIESFTHIWCSAGLYFDRIHVLTGICIFSPRCLKIFLRLSKAVWA